MFVRPCPSVLEKLLTRQVRFIDTLFFEPFDNFGFGGDGGVIRAGHPAGVLPFQSCATNQYILYRLVQHVPHVEYTGYVWRRNNHCKGLTTIRLAVKQTLV